MKNKIHIIPMAVLLLLFTASGSVFGFCGFGLPADTTVSIVPTCPCAPNNVAVMRTTATGCETKCISSKFVKQYTIKGWNYGCCLSARLSNESSGADVAAGIFPNPVTGTARITFTLKSSQPVSIRLTDVNGKQVAIIAEKVFGEGTNEIDWDSSELNNGVYLVEFRSGEFQLVKRLMKVN